ncbi:hypothetical protein PIB30_060298 [Stylosanthes scabra]|uniref:Uncharacterized protein n=1 Tax=Stylosanthes scabra TaxID=79078 RepID=A0ABU6WKD5_9FABA|nr:hypothetical protein [Stylosanthes scabra]
MSGPMYSDPHSYFVIKPKRFFEPDAMLVLGLRKLVLRWRDPHQFFKICRGSAKSTQKGGTGCFGVAATFTRKEPCSDLFPILVRCGKTTDA